MSNALIHKANELKPQTRAAVEAELGRALADDENVSIMTFSVHDSPSGELRTDAVQKLEASFQKADEHMRNVPEQETESALNEAIRKARPGYRERE